MHVDEVVCSVLCVASGLVPVCVVPRAGCPGCKLSWWTQDADAMRGRAASVPVRVSRAAMPCPSAAYLRAAAPLCAGVAAEVHSSPVPSPCVQPIAGYVGARASQPYCGVRAVYCGALLERRDVAVPISVAIFGSIVSP